MSPALALLLCAGLAAARPGAPAPEYAAYVSDLAADAIVKLRDLNGDGRYDGPGEAVVFFGPGNQSGFPGVGSAQAILVLGYDDVLAGDGEGSGGFTKRVYRARDLTGDGLAMGPDEAYVFWDSRLPIAGTPLADRPKAITIGPDGALYLSDNNTINFSGTTPEAIWRLEDLNADGVIDTDAGEVTLHKELSPAGNGFGFISEDFAWHSDGRLFFSNQHSSQNSGSVWILNPDGTLHQYASDEDFFGIGLQKVAMTLHPETENVVMAGEDVFGNRRIIEMVDVNGDGVINDNTELRFLYRSDVAAVPIIWGAPTGMMDIEYAPDGSLWMLDLSNRAIHRFVDLDGDGFYNGPGEAMTVYDGAVAQANGAHFIDFPRTIGFALIPGLPGDANGDGVVDFADLSIVLGEFGQTGEGLKGDLNGDGVVDFADLSIVLGAFGSGR